MNDTEKMGTITLVTPPSIIENLNETFCLLNFSDEDKDQFMNFLNEFYTKDTDNLTVYIADQNNNQFNGKWLTEAIEKSNNVIVKSLQGFKFLKSNKIKNLKEFFNGR